MMARVLMSVMVVLLLLATGCETLRGDGWAEDGWSGSVVLADGVVLSGEISLEDEPGEEDTAEVVDEVLKELGLVENHEVAATTTE